MSWWWASWSNFELIGCTVFNILQFLNFGNLRVASKCLLTPMLARVLGAYPPIDATHRPNSKKDRPWAESRHLSLKAWISDARFELGVGMRKKGQYRTGQDRKVTKGLYFTNLGRSPHWNNLHKKLFSRWRPRCNHVCQVSKWKFQGLWFYTALIFSYSYWLLNGPYNSAALQLRCVWQHLTLTQWHGVQMRHEDWLAVEHSEQT